MKIKKVSVLIATLALAVGLTGCMGGSQLPEGDVKVAKQEVAGVVSLLLESADYGKANSTVASLLLPEDSQYDIKLYMDKYQDGQLVETKDISTYTTGTLAKNDILHIVMNIAKENEGDAVKSIYSIAEVDKENSADPKQPEYKMTKVNEAPLKYDAKSEVAQVGKNLDEEIALVGFVNFKEDDAEKNPINLETYTDEVSKYSSADIIKVKVTKK